MTLQQQKAENKDRATKEEEEEEDSELDEADLLDEIDNDPELTGYREQRLKELKEEADRAKILRDSDRGRYTELQSEKEVLKVTTSEKRCIVHFFHQEFRRCKIMDKHLDVRHLHLLPGGTDGKGNGGGMIHTHLNRSHSPFSFPSPPILRSWPSLILRQDFAVWMCKRPLSL